jgi:hypothetical protein
MKQDEVVPVINRAGDRTLLLSDGRLGRFIRIPRIMHLFFPFQGARLPFTPASIEPFCRPVQRRGRVTARPVFARPFFLAESDPAVLLLVPDIPPRAPDCARRHAEQPAATVPSRRPKHAIPKRFHIDCHMFCILLESGPERCIR